MHCRKGKVQCVREMEDEDEGVDGWRFPVLIGATHLETLKACVGGSVGWKGCMLR